jgi:hypothetical protein
MIDTIPADAPHAIGWLEAHALSDGQAAVLIYDPSNEEALTYRKDHQWPILLPIGTQGLILLRGDAITQLMDSPYGQDPASSVTDLSQVERKVFAARLRAWADLMEAEPE